MGFYPTKNVCQGIFIKKRPKNQPIHIMHSAFSSDMKTPPLSEKKAKVKPIRNPCCLSFCLQLTVYSLNQGERIFFYNF